MKRHFRRLLFALAGLLWWLPPGAAAQTDSRLPTPPNSVRLLLSDADDLLADEDYAAAVDALQQVLDHEEDYFDPQAAGRSIKRHAERTIRLLPQAGREAYERRYGPQARALFTQAQRTGDEGPLSETVRRYLMTTAGADAAEALADRLWDRGEFVAAGRLFDRLVEHPAVAGDREARALFQAAVCWWAAGNEGRSRDRLTMWSRSAAAGSNGFAEGGPEDMDDALEWLSGISAAPANEASGEAFLYLRADPSRSGVQGVATPTGPLAWSYPAIAPEEELDSFVRERLVDAADEFDALRQQVRAEAGTDQPILPAGTPVIAGDRLVFRGYGRLKWLDPSRGDWLDSSSHADETFWRFVNGDEDPDPEYLRLFLGQRAWRDLTCGSLSADEDYVYGVFDAGILSAMGPTMQSIPAVATHPLGPRPYNRLMAYDLDLAQWAWEHGGPTATSDELMTGVFFLGPPLPLDEVYCLLDDRKQVRLVAIDPHRGAVVWAQSLYNADVHLSSLAAAPRRLSGLTPAAAGDILVCPTGETTLVAVDRRMRRLLWEFEYRDFSSDPRQQWLAFQMAQRQTTSEEAILTELLAADHWFDAAPIISDDRVLYSPPDHDELLCLRLTDGRLLWRRPRGDGLYVAGIHGGTVVLIETAQVRGIGLDDGEPVWERPIPIPAPSGRGFQHGRRYVLPLSSGEIITIDMAAGRVLARSPTPDGWTPGNLFSAQGRVYSQSADGLTAFETMDAQRRRIEERLAADADDPRALALRGEQRLHLGDIEGGIDDLRRSLAVSPDPRTQAILAATLIEGLRVDFAAYRDAADEIERLVRGTQQRITFLRLLAEGLQESGDLPGAFEVYLEFASEDVSDAVVDGSEGRRTVRTDRWVRARMQEIMSQWHGAQQAALDQLIGKAVERAVAGEDVHELRRLLAILPSHPAAERLRLTLVDRMDQDRTAERERQLLQLLRSADLQIRAAATARLARLYLDEGQAGPLDDLASQLSGPFADVEVFDGVTGAALAGEWRESDSFRELTAGEHWPTAHIEAEAALRRQLPQHYAVEHLGPSSPLLRGWTFSLDVNGSSLLAFDQHGRSRWRTAIGIARIGRGQRGTDYARYVRTLGRLVLLVTNDAFFVIDALAETGRPHVLHGGELIALSEEATAYPGRFRNPLANPRRALRNQVRISSLDSRPNGGVGPLTGDCLVYQQGTAIIAVDSLSGERLWVRESPEIPGGADIMADEEHIVVWPPGRGAVTVLRSTDGALVRRTVLPEGTLNPQPDGDWRTGVVVTEADDEKDSTRLALFDPVTDGYHWELDLSDVRDWALADGRDFGVLHGDGRFVLIDGLTGRQQFAVPVEAGEAAELFIDADADRLLLMTYRPPTEKSVLLWQELDFPRVHGRVTALQRTDGEMIWSRPVEHQAYMRHLPGRWPILAFAANLFEPQTGDAPENVLSVLVLNRETGEPVHEQTWDEQADKVGWLSVPDEHRLELSFEHASVVLRFREQPPEPERSEPAEEPEPPPQSEAASTGSPD